MRYLIRLHSLHSNSSYKLSHLQLSRNQNAPLSSISKSSKPKKTQKPSIKKEPETSSFSSLFNEITQILGADNVITDKTSSGFLISEETHFKNIVQKEDFLSCTPGVCTNAEDYIMSENENESNLKDTQIGILEEIDVDPVVHEITQIVRAENVPFSMEEQLKNTGFRFEAEIVEKVLKKCFKVPHLAIRFFNWVKLRGGFCHTTKTYNAMLSIAGEAKELGLVENLVEEMGLNLFDKDIKTWTILMSLYGKEKMIGKALMVYEKMRISGVEPDAGVYKVMIRSLCTAGKDDIALEFFKEMVQKDMGLDLNLYKMLLNGVARSGDVDAVHLLADKMVTVSQIPVNDVYGCVLKSFCVSGRIREALELIRDLKKKEVLLQPGYFETVVKGLCRADRIADALEIVDIMKRRQFVDGKIYGNIINGYLRKNDLSKALDVFQNMKECGYSPTTSTYTELMQRLFRLRKYKEGCDLYDEMLERGIKPDGLVITAMVAGHVSQNRIPEAWTVFKSMEDQGIRPTWKYYSVFIKELCKVSKTDEIFKVLDEMRASKIAIGDEIFSWVISCMERKREMDNVEKAKQVQRICKAHYQKGEVATDEYNDASMGQRHDFVQNDNKQEQGRIDYDLMESASMAYNEQDLQAIRRILSSSTDWSFIQEALERCTVHFTPELVVEILRNCNLLGNAALHFFIWVGKQAGYSHTTETYNMAMKISGGGKDFKHMRSLFYEMKRKGCVIASDTWAIMIMQYGRTGLTEIALRIFEEMKDSGCNPTGSTYKFLIISLCGKKGRKIDEAVKLFQEMTRVGYIPDKELIETYLGCLCEVGKLLEARKCVDYICEIGFTTPLGYSMYIRSLCRSGRLEEALAMIEEAGDERAKLDQYVYGSLVHVLLQKGRLEEALAKVEYMKQAGVYPTVHVYTSLINHFLKEKQIEKALEIFEKMQKEGCEPTVVTYSALICGFINMEKAADAWDVYNQMKQKGPLPDFKMYSMLISSLCKAGKSEEAMQLLYEMVNNGVVPSAVNFQTVFYGLNRDGKQDLAKTVIKHKLDVKNKRKFLT